MGRDYMGHHWWQHYLKSSVKNSPYKVFGHTGGGSGCRAGKFTLQHHYLNSDYYACKEDEIANYYNDKCRWNGTDTSPVRRRNKYYTELPIRRFSHLNPDMRDARGDSGITIYMAKDDPFAPRD